MKNGMNNGGIIKSLLINIMFNVNRCSAFCRQFYTYYLVNLKQTPNLLMFV